MKSVELKIKKPKYLRKMGGNVRDMTNTESL